MYVLQGLLAPRATHVLQGSLVLQGLFVVHFVVSCVYFATTAGYCNNRHLSSFVWYGIFHDAGTANYQLPVDALPALACGKQYFSVHLVQLTKKCNLYISAVTGRCPPCSGVWKTVLFSTFSSANK